MSIPRSDEVAPLYAFFPPFLFAFIGLEVDLSAFADIQTLLLLAAVTALAVVTKLAGACSAPDRSDHLRRDEHSRCTRGGHHRPASVPHKLSAGSACQRARKRTVPCRSERDQPSTIVCGDPLERRTDGTCDNSYSRVQRRWEKTEHTICSSISVTAAL